VSRTLAGSTAIVTGASRGLGTHIATRLAQRGVRLALVARSAPHLDELRRRLVDAGAPKVCAIAADVTIPSERQRVVDETEADVGPIDILVNNAGLELMAHYDELAPDDIARLLDVNLAAPMLLTRAVLPGMLARGRGHVVNMASTAGKVGAPFAASYTASKYGLVGFTQALRAEFLGQPVRFSAVCPGFVRESGMYADFGEALGIRAPRLVGTTTPAKVCDAVIGALEKDRAEIVVNAMPLRPLFTLLAAFPGATARVMRLTGVTRMMGKVADSRRVNADSAPVVIDLEEDAPVERA
jgi:short-subunit dehydrogenase